MLFLIIVGIFIAVMAIYAFWPRADHLGSRVNRAAAIAQGRAENFDNDGGGGGGGL